MKFYNDCRIFIYTDHNRAPRCNVTSDVGHRGTRLPRLLGLRAAMFTLSNTGCYQAEKTWQPRNTADWTARERVADDNLGSLYRLIRVYYFLCIIYDIAVHGSPAHVLGSCSKSLSIGSLNYGIYSLKYFYFPSPLLIARIKD